MDATQLAAAAEDIAKSFHEAYERLAVDHGYETREASRKEWEDVPVQNKRLMIATVEDLLREGIIAPGQDASTRQARKDNTNIEPLTS